MAHILPGLAHGSEVLAGVRDSYGIEDVRLRENRPRFAKIAVLWGLVGVIDPQYLYTEDFPALVYAFDHSHTFPLPPDWTRRALRLGRKQVPEPHPEILQACRFTPIELSTAILALNGIDDARIARAVGAPPDEWGITTADRFELAVYLATRRSRFLSSLSGTSLGRKP